MTGRDVPEASEELLEEIERRSEVGDEDQLVVRLSAHFDEEPIEYCHLAAERSVGHPPRIGRIVTWRIGRFGSRQFLLEVDEVGMLAELAKGHDRLERLRVLATEERLGRGRGDEVLVEVELESRGSAEDDVLVLDRYCVEYQCGRRREGGCDARYLERRSFVRRMMSLLTLRLSSLRHASPMATSFSEASPSRPLAIGFSNFLRNSFLVPRYPGLQKLRRLKYSLRSF